jgi:hypothetical protein
MFHLSNGNLLELVADSEMLNALPLNVLPHVLNCGLKLSSNCPVQHVQKLRARYGS